MLWYLKYLYENLFLYVKTYVLQFKLQRLLLKLGVLIKERKFKGQHLDNQRMLRGFNDNNNCSTQ